jgi:hypothetical protein
MAATSSLDHLSNRMKLEWHSKLNTEMVPAKNFRRTSIIGTIGMSCPHDCQKFLDFIARLSREMVHAGSMNERQKVANGQSLSRSQDQLR